MAPLPSSRDSILLQLERMLASDAFAGAGRSRALLKFLVEEAVEGRPDRLKEYTLGAEALGKGEAFDPRIDPIVRAEARWNPCGVRRERCGRHRASADPAPRRDEGDRVAGYRGGPEPVLLPGWTVGRLPR